MSDFSPNQWINRHREELAEYTRRYVAFGRNGIVATGTDLLGVLAEAKRTGQEFWIYFVPRRKGSIAILPIRLKSVSRHEWMPT